MFFPCGWLVYITISFRIFLDIFQSHRRLKYIVKTGTLPCKKVPICSWDWMGICIVNFWLGTTGRGIIIWFVVAGGVFCEELWRTWSDSPCYLHRAFCGQKQNSGLLSVSVSRTEAAVWAVSWALGCPILQGAQAFLSCSTPFAVVLHHPLPTSAIRGTFYFLSPSLYSCSPSLPTMVNLYCSTWPRKSEKWVTSFALSECGFVLGLWQCIIFTIVLISLVLTIN